MSGPESCSRGTCDRDATHEARSDETDEWRLLCKSHALGAFEFGESVRSLDGPVDYSERETRADAPELKDDGVDVEEVESR
jgi:hypothetical protein